MQTFIQKQNQVQEQVSSSLARSNMAPPAHRDHSILHLQRPIGNQAIQRFLQSHAEELDVRLIDAAPSRFGRDFSRIPIHPPTAGAIQIELATNQPGEGYEQEADDVSQQATRQPEPKVQRACDCSGACPKCQTEQLGHEHEHLHTKSVGSVDIGLAAVPPIVNEVLASSGQPLDPTTRAFMEPRFGYDFSGVRVHTDANAAESARAINALAYTVGRTVVFANGYYAPRTSEGQKLLAHELAHVVQQRGSDAGVAAAHAPALERDADRAAALVTAGLHARVDSSPTHAGLTVPQLQAKPRAWKGAYVDQDALIEYLMKHKKLSKTEAKKQVPAIIAKMKPTGDAVVAAYPGLKDKKFDYDLFQDVVVGPDSQVPNCFGDVCRGAKQRWEPDKAELDGWLKQEGYAGAKSCACECGVKKVAVYAITLKYTDGGKLKSFVQPYHIAEQQEDCTWRSRLGDLGVIIHDRAEQLVSQAAAEHLAKQWATAIGVSFQSGKVELLCYAKKHGRAGYHGSPGGPLSCSAGKKK